MPISKAAFGLGEDPEPEEEVEETEAETSTEDEETDPILGEEEEAEDEDPFADPEEEGDEEEGGEGRRKPAVERRIDKLVAERQTAREEALREHARADTLEEQVEGLRELNSTFDQLYGRFDDPAEQLRFDAALIGELERETQSNAELAKLLKPLIEKVGDNPMPEERTEPKSETPAGPDALTVRMVEKEAASVISSALPDGVRPAFANNLRKEIFNALDPADLADLSEADVLSAARDLAKKDGWRREDIYESGSAKPKDETPPTGGKSRPATRTRSAKQTEEAKSDDAPKTPQEWRARNIKRLEDAIGGE